MPPPQSPVLFVALKSLFMFFLNRDSRASFFPFWTANFEGFNTRGSKTVFNDFYISCVSYPLRAVLQLDLKLVSILFPVGRPRILV